MDPAYVLLPVGLLLIAAIAGYAWHRFGPAAGVASLLGGLGIFAGLVSLWKTLQPVPTQKDPPPHPLTDAERERVRADIERRQEAAEETRQGLDHAMAAETPDEQSARLLAMPRKSKPLARAAPTMPPDETPAAPRKRQ